MNNDAKKDKDKEENAKEERNSVYENSQTKLN